MVDVPLDEAKSILNPERSIAVGQRLRSSTYWVSDDPDDDHMTSLMTTDALILEYVAAPWAFHTESETFPDTAETDVVQYVTVPVTFNSISLLKTAVAEVTETDVPEKANQSFAGIPWYVSERVTVTFPDPS